MNTRMNAIALGCMTLGLLSGCTSQSSKPTHIALASMDQLSVQTEISVQTEMYDPLRLAAGDTLGMELHIWHVVCTDPDPTWLLAVGD